jgi:hypothetical protein
MTTLVHETLGNERIKQICNNVGLTSEDAKIVDQILEEWEQLIGKIDQKKNVFIKKTRDNPHRKEIEQALFVVSTEFFIKRIN